MVLVIFLFELHCPHRGQRVIDVVERIEVDMQLVVPETAAVEEIIRVVFSPRHILLFQLLPLRRALLRRQFRIGVADVLELIHRHAERHKCDRLL